MDGNSFSEKIHVVFRNLISTKFLEEILLSYGHSGTSFFQVRNYPTTPYITKYPKCNCMPKSAYLFPYKKSFDHTKVLLVVLKHTSKHASTYHNQSSNKS